MTRLRWILWILLPLFGLCFTPRALSEPVKLMVVSDLHYLSPTCFNADEEGYFLSFMRKGDGKMTQYSVELLEGLKQEALKQRPDALVLTGDLTFNGELASHQELAEALGEIQAEGIPVYVIPGNHDINMPNTYTYEKYAIFAVPNISPEEFETLYADFRGEPADTMAQFSSLVRLRENLWLALCDASIYTPQPMSEGLYTVPLRGWLKSVLAQAQTEGAQVISATHQSVVPHTQVLLESMTVKGYETMQADLRESGVVPINLSGHLHIQHISEQEGLYDIATGAFSVPPFRFGLLTVSEEGEITYDAQELSPEFLPSEVNEQAKTWFEDIFVAKDQAVFEQLDLPEEEKQEILFFGGRINHAYFSGELGEDPAAWMADPLYLRLVELTPEFPFAAHLTELPKSPEINRRSALHLRVEAPTTIR